MCLKRHSQNANPDTQHVSLQWDLVPERLPKMFKTQELYHHRSQHRIKNSRSKSVNSPKETDAVSPNCDDDGGHDCAIDGAIAPIILHPNLQDSFAACQRTDQNNVRNDRTVDAGPDCRLYTYFFDMCLYVKTCLGYKCSAIAYFIMQIYQYLNLCFVFSMFGKFRYDNSQSLLRPAYRFVLKFTYMTFRYLYDEKHSSESVSKYSHGIKCSTPTIVVFVLMLATKVSCFENEFDKSEQFLDKINLEQSIAAVFNKVAYGSTTKRSIPDTAYPITTLATPLLTTYRYSDGSDEYLRVDVKKPDPVRPIYEYERPKDPDPNPGYGLDLEKDHALPTTAPAADILKNNNNRHYDNPNRYNNDRLKPNLDNAHETATENVQKITTSYNILRNIRPTKSIYNKDVPSYVPPSKTFFTPPLPPEYLNPFADKPTLRGTNSDGFGNRRPFPPPSLMPNKERIPFRPNLPPSKVNIERIPDRFEKNSTEVEVRPEKKKTLNTPSQNVNVDRVGELYGSRVNESSFEYEKGYIPSITRILSGSNGHHDDISDILLKSVTAIPNVQRPETKITKHRPVTPVSNVGKTEVKNEQENSRTDNSEVLKKENVEHKPKERSESVTVKKSTSERGNNQEEATTVSTSLINLPNVKEKEQNATKTGSDEIWLICWNVHVYLVVLCFVVLALYSIYKLIRYENDPHMFSKSYFLTIHLMLTVICVLRIFYLMYDPYNAGGSFNIFLYDFLHNFPLSLLATTFAVLILFLLKRTLTHLKVKTSPMFLVIFGVLHIFLCFCLSISEALGHFERASLIVCRPVFVLLALALGLSYLYLYRIIKNVLTKKSQNLSETCTRNISHASHVTIAVALLFVMLGFVQLYALFFIKVDKFSNDVRNPDWKLWGFELCMRLLEICIISLLAIVVSLKISQREKQTVGFPLFPCTTSESSTDNIYPNNCNANPNVTNYSRNEMAMDGIPSTDTIERPNLLKNAAFQNDSFDRKSTLERYRDAGDGGFDRFERPKWGSERFDSRSNIEQTSLNNFPQDNFERNVIQNSSRGERNSSRKAYDAAKYYAKPKYDVEYDNEDFHRDVCPNDPGNVYSEPLDHQNQYERTRHEFERSDFDRRSRNSSNTSGRRSTTGRSRKNHPRPHLGIQTLPNHEVRNQVPDSMLVDDQGFVRFRHMQEMMEHNTDKQSKRLKKHNNDVSHYSDA